MDKANRKTEIWRMKVFEYRAIVNEREAIEEFGMVLAKTEERANAKLRDLGYAQIRTKQLHGLAALFNRFRAGVK